MKLNLLLTLLPQPAQHTTLTSTIECFNAACNDIAATAFRVQETNRGRLQTLVYTDIRARFGLSAQMTVRAVAKAAEAYKRDPSTQPHFEAYGTMVYDPRILSFKGLDTASLLTLTGRQWVKFIMIGYQREPLAAYGRRGQADLLYRQGIFLLAVVVEVPEPAGIAARIYSAGRNPGDSGC